MNINSNSGTKKQTSHFVRLAFWVILSVALILGGIKGWRIYQKSMTVYRDANALRGMARVPYSEMDIGSIRGALIGLQGDLDALNNEVEPFLWLAPKLDWIPVYGGDLSNAPSLLEVVDYLTDASTLSLNAAQPVWNIVN